MTPYRWVNRVALVVVWIMASGSIQTALAQSDGTGIVADEPMSPPAFAIVPAGETEGAYFSATVDPGSSVTFTALLVNAGEQPFAALTYAADAFTTVNGGMGVLAVETPPTGPTTWIDYGDETLTIAPGSAAERRFTVAIPDDARPGQYIAGLVLQTASPLSIGDSAMFNQILRKTVAVFITIPGPVEPGMEIGDIALSSSDTGDSISVALTNSGNILLRPMGTIVLRDEGGEAVATVPVAMGSVYAGHSTAIEIALPERLPAGDLTVDVELEDAQQAVAVTAGGTISVAAEAAAEAVSPLTLDNTVIVAMPSPERIQYLDIATRITNSGEAVTNGRLSLQVSRDGTLVESFPLATSLSIATGPTDVAQRYIPAGGWTPGAYTFALELEAVDAATGAASLLADAAVDGTLTVR